MNFKNSLYNPDEFTITFELVPSRGGRNRKLDRTMDLAREIAADGRIRAVSITDNAGGHPALSPEALGLEIMETGLDVISHFSCKDKNRNEIESQLFAWDRAGLANLLVITGDYPKSGYCGQPKPVFDLDCIHVLDILSRMNRGRYADRCTMATTFCKGVAISPFKRTRAEQEMQYCKLRRKSETGADYAISQLGFDPRKFHELLLYMEENQINLPLLGTIFVPNMTLARLIHAGKVPGCVMSSDLLNEMESQAGAEDKGKKARLKRAALLMATLRGMGYHGAHIGGPGLSMEDLDFLLNQAAAHGDNWQELIPPLSSWPEDGFFYYEKDPANGLNLAAKTRPTKPAKTMAPAYGLARIFHNLAFEPEGFLYPAAKRTCLALEKTMAHAPLHGLEHLAKFILFACRDCGDCNLSRLAFLCPQSGCAKYLLNGPCGGSRDGWCEVYPQTRKCLYVKVHDRLAANNDLASFQTGIALPRDWRLANTSAWLNFYKGIDNSGNNCLSSEE